MRCAFVTGATGFVGLNLVREIATLLGKPLPTREAPALVVRTVAAVKDLLSRVTGREPSITPEMAAGFGSVVTATAAKARRDLGFKVVPLSEMVRDCHDWMVAERRI